MQKLIILRGNSGSGKTTIAKELQNRFGEEAMRRWWREKDFSDVLNEIRITSEQGIDSIVADIYNSVLNG